MATSDEFTEPERQEEAIAIKWIAEDAHTLSALAERLESYAAYLRELEARGYQLSQPIDGGMSYATPGGRDPDPDDELTA